MRRDAPVGFVFDTLLNRYEKPPRKAHDPFAVLVATILSHRTNDDVTGPAARRILNAYPTAKTLADADPDHVAELARPVGFYNQKADALVQAAKHLLEHHEGRVPDDEEALLAIHSVGRKTANCVLAYAYGHPVVPVDTHVHRITNRLGWVDTDHPEATETRLNARLTPDQRRCVNELMVRFGREICKPRTPRCGDCPLQQACPSDQGTEATGLGEPEGPTMLARIAKTLPDA